MVEEINAEKKCTFFVFIESILIICKHLNSFIKIMGSKRKKLAKRLKQAIKKTISKKQLKGNAKLVKKAANKLAKKLLGKRKSAKSNVIIGQHPVVWSADYETTENEIAEALEAEQI